MSHEFMMLEKNEIVPMLSQLRKAQGRERKALIEEWSACLLEDAISYIAELQSMGYYVQTVADLMDMARELDYYQIASGSYLVK